MEEKTGNGNEAENASDHEDPPVTDDTFQDLVVAQREATEARREETKLQRERLELDRDTAHKALDIQKEDRREQRDHHNRIHQRNLRYGLGFVTVLALLLVAMIWLGEADVALRLVQIAVIAGSTYTAGRAVGRREANDSD